MPDTAVDNMESVLRSVFESALPSQPPIALESSARLRRMDCIALRCDSHHYAVGVFYKTYYPRSGSPPLSIAYLDSLLEMEKQGLNDVQIATKCGATTEEQVKKDADRIRHALDTAHALWDKKVTNIYAVATRQRMILQSKPKTKKSDK